MLEALKAIQRWLRNFLPLDSSCRSTPVIMKIDFNGVRSYPAITTQIHAGSNEWPSTVVDAFFADTFGLEYLGRKTGNRTTLIPKANHCRTCV